MHRNRKYIKTNKSKMFNNKNRLFYCFDAQINLLLNLVVFKLL